jgi:hypothetical protein
MYIHIIHSVKKHNKIGVTVCSILQYKIQRHVSAFIRHHQVVGKNLLKTRHKGGRDLALHCHMVWWIIIIVHGITSVSNNYQYACITMP